MQLLQTNSPALPKLDARLAAACAYVRSESRCADIGCDHGKLSVTLCTQHGCKKVIACDIRPKPLQQAARNLALHGCTSVAECRLGNGLCVVAPHEVDDIVIAGVSGITICDILAQAQGFWQQQYRFILVPASKPDVLRRWLCEQGFAVLDETPVEAAGRFYTVLHVQYTGNITHPTPLFCAIGRAGDKPTLAAVGYLAKIEGQLKKQGDLTLAKAVNEVKTQCETSMKL